MDRERNTAQMVRDSLLSSERWLTAAEVASLLGADETSREDVDRLRRERRMLGVRLRSEYLYPDFQFLSDSGGLHPEIAALLAFLPDDDHGWAAALWCFAPTLKLAGERPADAFEAHANKVIDAARRDFLGDDRDW